MSNQSCTESFAISNVIGPDMDNVPLLLRRIADELEKRGPMCVYDLILRTDVEAEGYRHSVKVYFTSDERDIEASRWHDDIDDSDSD